MCYIHKLNATNIAKKWKEKELVHSTTWVNFIDIKINKRRQTQKSTLKNKLINAVKSQTSAVCSQSTSNTENLF